MKSTGSVLAAYLAMATLAGADAPVLESHTLTSRDATLLIRAESIHLSRSIAGNPKIEYQTTASLNLNVLDKAGASYWSTGKYASIRQTGSTITCTGELQTQSGAAFHFVDTYATTNIPNAFVLSREISVKTPGEDAGFLSRFSLRSSAKLEDHDVFIPGIWYGDNSRARPGALGTNPSDTYYLIREDRMPLPLVMMRHKRRGDTVTLVHLEPDGSTCLADYSGDRVIDGRIQVASLGIISDEKAAVSFCYPATEGERSYLRSRTLPRDENAKRWAERFHPVEPGVSHRYKILVHLSEERAFPHAMRNAWRTAFHRIHPPAASTDLRASYEAGISLLAKWSTTTKGAPGIPFRLRLPGGELESPEMINYQMGFVGQQLPLAYHLLRYGLVRNKVLLRDKGEAMVDFWAAHSPTKEGLPCTWYDTFPEPHWRPYNTYLRVACDGMVGALMAWDIMQKFGHPKPEWMKFCKGFGDWLVQHQNADGSWYREYAWDGTPAHRGKENTTHPIRFLVDLWKATGTEAYRKAALKAGAFCWRTVHQGFTYVGGTVDNPNVMDKEAGFMAMEAFLALRDATGDQKWLNAAVQAADFTETWAYCWNIPIPKEDLATTYPRSASTTGFSIIATGHSGADLFLAGAPFLYYRVYLATGDEHYADFARQLLYDTKQSVDIDGSLGYGHPGLCTEALSLSVDGQGRGHGVNVWLPWLTHNMIAPIVRLEEAYGMTDTPTVRGEKLRQLRAKDQEYSRNRGLQSLPSALHEVEPMP